MLLVGEVKVVHLLLEGVEDLAVSGHVSGQDQSDDRLRARQDNADVTDADETGTRSELIYPRQGQTSHNLSHAKFFSS